MKELKSKDWRDQLIFHLLIKYLFRYTPDQIGVLVDSELEEFPGRYVMFHDGKQLRLLEADEVPEDTEEFSTVSYGPLN